MEGTTKMFRIVAHLKKIKDKGLRFYGMNVIIILKTVLH